MVRVQWDRIALFTAVGSRKKGGVAQNKKQLSRPWSSVTCSSKLAPMPTFHHPQQCRHSRTRSKASGSCASDKPLATKLLTVEPLGEHCISTIIIIQVKNKPNIKLDDYFCYFTPQQPMCVFPKAVSQIPFLFSFH